MYNKFDMAKFKYTNTSKNDLSVIGVGKVKAGEVIESNSPLNNPNLELLVDKPERKKKDK